MNRLSEKEVAKKIDELTKKLQNTTEPKERRKLQHAIFHYKHYNERLNDAKNKKMAKRLKNVTIDDLSSLNDDVTIQKREDGHKPRIYSRLEMELWECKSTDHIKLNTDDFKKYMSC